MTGKPNYKTLQVYGLSGGFRTCNSIALNFGKKN